MIEKLRTILPALLTTFHEDGSLDEEAYGRIVRHAVDHGMHTLFTLGYTGEVRALDEDERRRVIEITREKAPDAYIVAGCLGDSLDIIVKHIDVAAAAGADMALVTPTDFFHLSDAELEQMFIDLNEWSKLPIMIYNCPENQHFVSAEIIARLAKLDKIVALKQSTMSDKIQEVLWSVDPSDEFLLLQGDELCFFPSLCLGVEGYIMGGPGNICPDLAFEIWDDYKAGNFKAARAKYMRFAQFINELYTSFPYDVIAVIKATMELAGVCKRYMKKPTRSVADEDMPKIKALCEKYDIKLS